jgi:hypothetical protein
MTEPLSEGTGGCGGCVIGAVLGLIVGSVLGAVITAATERGYGTNPAARPGFGTNFPFVAGGIGGGFLGLILGAICGGILGRWMATKPVHRTKATEEGKGIFRDNRAEPFPPPDLPG